jgi:hypothetical protein
LEFCALSPNPPNLEWSFVHCHRISCAFWFTLAAVKASMRTLSMNPVAKAAIKPASQRTATRMNPRFAPLTAIEDLRMRVESARSGVCLHLIDFSNSCGTSPATQSTHLQTASGTRSEWMAAPVADFLIVDGSLVRCFDGTTLAHQMPYASAVHHITVFPTVSPEIF